MFRTRKILKNSVVSVTIAIFKVKPAGLFWCVFTILLPESNLEWSLFLAHLSHSDKVSFCDPSPAC